MRNTTKHFILCMAILVVVFGCSLDNTMYNARKYFKSAQNRPLNPNGKPTPQAIDDYTKTIKKCGYVLTERKNSPDADDALFLLAQSLFFKGSSQFQAKDQFESLIRNFPDSPFAPQSTMFIAQIYRQINDNKQAEIILEEYIRRPATIKWHPMAISLLADFAIQDKDFIKAQFWLEKILTQFPKSIEYKEASYLLGKNYYEKKDYESSLAQFQKVVSTKGIKSSIKLDAKYYIALNLLLLNKTQQSLTTISKLLKIEDRPEKIPQLKLLKGRVLLAMNNFEEANELLQAVIKTNARTTISCEAYYWLGEYYFYQIGDTKNAIDSYNKSKAEISTSDFSTESTKKYTALMQIYQGPSENKLTNPSVFIENKMSTVDNYFHVLNLPDSAFAVIDSIKQIPNEFQTQIDTLNIQILYIEARMDSLIVTPDSTNIQNIVKPAIDSVKADSLAISSDSTRTQPTDEIDKLKPSLVDSVSVDSFALNDKRTPTQPDSLAWNDKSTHTQPDSLNTLSVKVQVSDSDSLSFNQTPSIRDSLSSGRIRPPAPTIKDRALYNQYKQQQASIEQQIMKLTDIQTVYNKEYIPYSIFLEASLITLGLSDTALVRQSYQNMAQQYPSNKYTNALRLVLEGKEVRLIDADMEIEEINLDKALEEIDTIPDSALAILDSLSKSIYPDIRIKANFRLGWYYSFEQPDTAKAKPPLSEVIKTDRASDYAQMVLRFFNGTKYTFTSVVLDTLKVNTLRDSLGNLVNPDSLKTNSVGDSIKTNQQNTPEGNTTPVMKDDKEQPTPAPGEIIHPINKPDEPFYYKPD